MGAFRVTPRSPRDPRLLFAILVCAPIAAGHAQQLTPGMVITRSVKIPPRVYPLPSTSLDSAAITIRGDNITVDLTGVTLLGADSIADPDQARGLAIHIDGGRNVRIIGPRIRGYKIGLLATGTRQLVLQNVDAGYNWKPRLYSLVEHESLADWLSFHQNEKREWFRYGAGIYLEDVKGGEVRGSRITQGMNGLMLVRSDSLLIRDNDFWYNSGLGIGLYRSSDNTIVRNRLDYNVRGYSHGFYHRGQDSADLLLYEQSSRNIVAWNSATHGGDGVFLWAGQSTMDTGQGGANDNVFFANDFSYAPANAIEATFSRNKFIGNTARGSDYGVWAGYSWGSVIAGNCFAGNRTGIAIEHGQDNTIIANRFEGDTTAMMQRIRRLVMLDTTVFDEVRGDTASTVPAVIVAFTISPVMGLLVLGLYILVQQLENNILVPKVMQKFIGLNPVVSIVALLIGFEIGGIVGSILAIPVATMIQVVLEELFANRAVGAPRA